MLRSKCVEPSSLDHRQIPPGSLSVPCSEKHLGAIGSQWGLLGSLGGKANGKPLWYSRLENSLDGGAWQTTVHVVTKSRIQLSIHTHVGTTGKSGWAPD